MFEVWLRPQMPAVLGRQMYILPTPTQTLPTATLGGMTKSWPLPYLQSSSPWQECSPLSAPPSPPDNRRCLYPQESLLEGHNEKAKWH
ncbi:hypothetical protein BGX38DRAFT_332051 [Terfezia claveryi]|nr:hypothetical protein BGX38DRAFT_332051 [Terfezia claveryi]